MSTKVTQTKADGSVVTTVSDSNADGSLRDRAVTTTSANGLSVTTQRDSKGTGTFDTTRTDVTSLNADGSGVETVTDFASGAKVDQILSTTSANGLATTAQYDLTGAGTFSETKTDLTVVNADDSKTETVTYTGTNGALISRYVATTSANGLSIAKQWDTTGSGSFDQTTADVTAINAGEPKVPYPRPPGPLVQGCAWPEARHRRRHAGSITSGSCGPGRPGCTSPRR